MNPKYLDQHGIKYYRSEKGILHDYEICFSTKADNWKKALIDLNENKGHRLEGVVYEIDRQALSLFDDIEGISEGKHHRIDVPVENAQGAVERAFTYICPLKEGYFKPSKEYVDLIVEGAQINTLSDEHVEYIRSFLD